MSSGSREIPCEVCDERIDISTKRDQHVVKCEKCGEATVSVVVISMKKGVVTLPLSLFLLLSASSFLEPSLNSLFEILHQEKSMFDVLVTAY